MYVDTELRTEVHVSLPMTFAVGHVQHIFNIRYG